ncbi:prolipoprotein diacylglyceryl transferase [Wenzhouxiangella marina]|uniref:Phosphatidylglycerol--prolipoprotein diacylglyceryl transferase n=1 Tax=Wenzhouxiangella marina TaxID=1579979 RepID=A0A0K0XSS1_9GAMM|nr:prolipoprotein diacylglyceryl transferase [Wenzhouxiangella marina]AKS40723.1 Prolipoprotein diacylglyceryl transferase [Wenzhouxiangella marina]MBB6087596.1 phosphatidylglycerol:prolipoprotein diacylglycerol transferase [Wenzhouxiangella marina]
MQSEFFFHNLDPVALNIGGFGIYWYSLMYLVAFGQFWLLGRVRARRADTPLNQEQVGDLLFWGVIGVIAGGRIGYVLFYALGDLLADPLLLFRIRDGGMSFHGGLIGVLVAMALYGRSLGCGFLRLGDFVAPLIPLGLAAGRLGNFIGGELWGRLSQAPWAVIFPNSIEGGGPGSGTLLQQYQAGQLDAFARHPSQLYQALLEGVALFVLLWIYSRRERPVGAVGGAFLLGYGVFRFIAEFFREPDAHLGFVALDWMTMGQILSLPMVLIGIALLVWAYRRKGA